MNKQKLLKELDAIEKQERESLIKVHHPIFKKKYEGKYFKTKNRYSRSEDWWMYTKVTEIKPEDIYDTNGNGITAHYTGWIFQTDYYGDINVKKEKYGYVHSVGTEISEKEFMAAYNKMITAINNLIDAQRTEP